jgi:hypothetical protein
MTMAEPDRKDKYFFEITVYNDKFVIAYLVILLIYLLIGFAVYIFPYINPDTQGDIVFRFSLMFIPVLYLAVVTVAVIGIAMRAQWAPKFYAKTAKTFLVLLVLCSFFRYISHGLFETIGVTILLLIIFSPLIIVMLYGFRYLKRADVRESFEKAASNAEYRVY